MARIPLEELSQDAIAGAVTAVLLVPQALAYALLAGLPPETGLYASILPALVYAYFGSSPSLSVGPVAVVSLMIATTLMPLHAAESIQYVQDAALLALFSGVMLYALGALRLGVLANFLSFPVMSGFAMGAAILIMMSQIPQMLGLHLNPSGNFAHQGLQIFEHLGESTLIPIAISGLSIIALLVARRGLGSRLQQIGVRRPIARAIPRVMPLVLVVLGSTLAGLLSLKQHGVQLVGHLGGDIPKLVLPVMAWEQWPSLIEPAALIGLIGYLEGISIAQVIARRHRHLIVANKELVAIGLANVAAALSQSMPVAGSLSRSVVNDAAGARTRMAGVIAAALVAGSSVFLAPMLETLPRAVLAAIIVVAVLRLLDWTGLIRVWRYDRADAMAWGVTALGVLALGAEVGFIAGLALSLLLYIWRTANPHIVEVGHSPNTYSFVEADRFQDLEFWPQLLLVRVDESLFFGNSAAVQSFILNKVSSRPDVTDVILICSAINAIDSSALQMLEDLSESLLHSSVKVHLADVKGSVMDRLEGSRLLDELGRDRIHFSTISAISALASPPI